MSIEEYDSKRARLCIDKDRILKGRTPIVLAEEKEVLLAEDNKRISMVVGNNDTKDGTGLLENQDDLGFIFRKHQATSKTG